MLNSVHNLSLYLTASFSSHLLNVAARRAMNTFAHHTNWFFSGRIKTGLKHTGLKQGLLRQQVASNESQKGKGGQAGQEMPWKLTFDLAKR